MSKRWQGGQSHVKVCIFREDHPWQTKMPALRKRLTSQEVKLWMRLRELKGLGFHFRRQAPIGRYIVDFVSFQSRLVIEADGGQHGMPESARSDEVRDAFLQSQGFQVLRFWNSDIDANLEGVMESSLGTLKHVPSR
jgi:very-short-patch-repair endonuclease